MSNEAIAAASILVLTGCATAKETRVTMPAVSSDLKPAVVALKDRLGAAQGVAETTNKAEVKLLSNQHNQAVTRGFTLAQDEPERAGGTNLGPTPTDFFIASVGFCENVVFARYAALLELTIDSLETSVAGAWDMKGLFGIDGATPAFKTITVETRVATRDPAAKVAEAARLTHERCPIHATLRKSVEMIFKLSVNGQPVDL